jgi:predicted ATPase/transcriptional regulator with XRE-family HTH domain
MMTGAPGRFGAHLKALRETAGFTQEELATIAGLSVHAVSALERGERRRPHVETLRALMAALDLAGPARDALLRMARTPPDGPAIEELSGGALPVPPTGVVGRDADVEALVKWLNEPRARLITLVGPGGVGKTRLALEIGRRMAEDGRVRAVFVELAGVRDHAFVGPAIAEALGLSDVTSLDLPGRVRSACTGDPILLLLDNCEQILAAAPLVVELVAATTSIRILATSRAPFRVRGERLYVVRPLPCDTGAHGTSPADVIQVPAVRLFVERVRDVQPAFRLTVDNVQAVVAICRRLDALPLALELAAPWMKTLTADDLLARLERGVLLSTTGARDLPERQRTMNATVAWSYQLLDGGEQRAFRRFGGVPCRFSIEAAAAVLGGFGEAPVTADDALVAMAGLIDKSLLHRADSAQASRPLYQMLETVQAYAASELDAFGERDQALEGLARYCVDEASHAEHGLIGPSQIEWLDRVRDDLDNYRCALTWLTEHGRNTEAVGIAWQLMFFWIIRGRAAEGLRWYEQALSVPDLLPAAASRALVGAAIMSYTQGDLGSARARALRAVELARSADDRTVVVQGENLLGHIEHASGNAASAGELFTRCVAGFKSLGLAWGTGNALIGKAGVALAFGDTAQAERLLDEATATLRETGPWFLNLPLYIRAILAVRRGDADAAIGYVRETVTCSRQLHDRFAFVYALIPLAAAAALRGDDVWVAKILGARDAITERTATTGSDKSVRDLRDRAEAQARARLTADGWSRAYAAGRSASIDSLLHDIESALP